MTLPEEVPVMTLSNAVLFPHAVMPLYIFEPRYRTMLEEALGSDRVFAVATLDEERVRSGGVGEPACPVAGVGVIRACTKNEDGTSNLILQGLARVRFETITTEQPYRRARIRTLASVAGAEPEALAARADTLLALIETKVRLGAEIPDGVVDFLRHVDEPETALDMAIYALCASAPLKQRLLETIDVAARFALFETHLRERIAELKLQRKLEGGLDDDRVGFN